MPDQHRQEDQQEGRPEEKPRPLVCVGALVREPGGRVLLVQTTKWRGAWGVPGGKVEWGETLEQALRREFLEETGLALAAVRYAQTQEAVQSPEFHKPAHMLLVDFVAQTAAHENQPQVRPNEEIQNWAWVSLAEASRYPLNSYTRTLLSRATQMWNETPE